MVFDGSLLEPEHRLGSARHPAVKRLNPSTSTMVFITRFPRRLSS